MSQATRGSERKSHNVLVRGALCCHGEEVEAVSLRGRPGVRGERDFVGERSGSGKEVGWPRVETILVGVKVILGTDEGLRFTQT